MGIWAKQSSESPQQATWFQPPHIGATSTLRPRSTHTEWDRSSACPRQEARGTCQRRVACWSLSAVTFILLLCLFPPRYFTQLGSKKQRKKKKTPPFRADAAKS